MTIDDLEQRVRPTVLRFEGGADFLQKRRENERLAQMGWCPWCEGRMEKSPNKGLGRYYVCTSQPAHAIVIMPEEL